MRASVRFGLHQSPSGAEEAYFPYAIDWRFLPEPALVAKDFVRHHLVRQINKAAQDSRLAHVWRRTFGAGTIRAIRRTRILFIHVTKSGGTSISKCLYGRNLPHYSARFYHQVFPSDILGFPSFAVIRHPVDRALSAYEFLRRGGSEIMACDHYDRWRLGSLDSLETLVERLEAQRRDLSGLPSAFHEQCGFILDQDGRVMVDRLFAMDRAQGLPGELSTWLGGRQIPHLNSTRADRLNIDPAIARRIETIYGRDLALYDHLMSSGGVCDIRGSRPQGVAWRHDSKVQSGVVS